MRECWVSCTKYVFSLLIEEVLGYCCWRVPDEELLVPFTKPIHIMPRLKQRQSILFSNTWCTPRKLGTIQGSHLKYVKHRIDVLDKEKMTYTYTLIEGDSMMDKIESITYEVKLEPSPNGGCIGKNISTYHPKPGVVIKEEEIKAGKEQASGVFKAVEAYLLANPDAYV